MAGKKIILLALAALLLMFSAGCQAEPEEFDQAALVAVSDYVEEMSAALTDETLKADLQGWVREPYEEELPLRYDAERLQWLEEHRVQLQELWERHRQAEEFPAVEEIAAWEVLVVRGDHEWLLEGEKALSALEDLDALYRETTGTIEMVIATEGELDLAQSDAVQELIGSLEERAETARLVYFP